ncbi:MAG: ABC transporter ATP-binding protein [Chitinophagaceae bacterium]|nr:ABC transporter ATP-binding protein [Chitinophagaceae bacterium]
MLKAEGIYKRYGQKEVLKGVEILIEKASLVSIVGASGAGKSTLLHILGTLDTPDSGTIFLQEKAIHTLKGNALADFRNRHMGFIFQFHHLLPEFSVLENICIPAWIAGTSKTKAKQDALTLMKVLAISDLSDKKPGQLSGGEQQRTAIARALINKPDIVFADEPTGNLDSNNAREMQQLFLDLRNQFGQTFLIVTHNEELAGICDRKLTMKDGLIIH